MAVMRVNGVQQSDGEVFKVLTPGLYPGEVISSKFQKIENPESDYNGTTMLMLGIKCTDPETQVAVTAQHMIMIPDENLDAEETRKSLAKLKRLQEATNTVSMGDNIDDEAFMYANVNVELGVRPARGNFPEQNSVRDILPM